MTIKNDLKMTSAINKAIIDLVRANNYTMRHNEQRVMENLVTALEHIKEFTDDIGLIINVKYRK